MPEPLAASSFDTNGWLWKRFRRVLWGIGIVAALLLFSAIASQCDGKDEPEPVTTPLVTIRPVDAPTRGDVADALYGTATCINDPSYAIVTAVTPAKSACNGVAFEGIWDGPIQVVASNGRMLASGQAGNTPPCVTPDYLEGG